jgi:Prokaryotic cytochrome b561
VQKILYLGVILVGILIVITGLCLWKPVQFSELAGLFYSFQTIRVIHFLCMAAIVGFIVVHVSLALLVPQTLVAMVTGGPVVDGAAAFATDPAHAAPVRAPEPTPPAEPAPSPEPVPIAESAAAAESPAATEPPAAESPGPTNEPTQ